MYWIIFVMLSISHCIGVSSVPLKTAGDVDELLEKISFLIESNITCEPQAQFYTTSSSGLVNDSLDCVRRELNAMEAECLNSTTEKNMIGDDLKLTIMLMDRMYNKTTRADSEQNNGADCDEQKPLQDFLEKLRLLVQKDFSG